MSVFEFPASAAVILKALVTTPPDYDPAKESLPMIVFLHGAGQRGDDLEKVKIHGIPKYFSADPCHLGLRVITVSPQCPDGLCWNNLARELYDFIVAATETYHADPDRVSITGISMGGFGTWEMLVSHPELFAAAAPICGGGMSWRIPQDLPVPVRTFHGDADPVVPICLSYDMADAVNARGGHCEFTVYHGCDHDSWSRTYEKTDVIEWLAGCRRKTR